MEKEKKKKCQEFFFLQKKLISMFILNTAQIIFKDASLRTHQSESQAL
jgi:hypothetical protein